MRDPERENDSLYQALAAMRAEVDDLITSEVARWVGTPRSPRNEDSKASEPSAAGWSRGETPHRGASGFSGSPEAGEGALPTARTWPNPATFSGPDRAGAGTGDDVATSNDTEERLEALARRLEGRLRRASDRAGEVRASSGKPEACPDPQAGSEWRSEDEADDRRA